MMTRTQRVDSSTAPLESPCVFAKWLHRHANQDVQLCDGIMSRPQLAVEHISVTKPLSNNRKVLRATQYTGLLRLNLMGVYLDRRRVPGRVQTSASRQHWRASRRWRPALRRSLQTWRLHARRLPPQPQRLLPLRPYRTPHRHLPLTTCAVASLACVHGHVVGAAAVHRGKLASQDRPHHGMVAGSSTTIPLAMFLTTMKGKAEAFQHADKALQVQHMVGLQPTSLLSICRRPGQRGWRQSCELPRGGRRSWWRFTSACGRTSRPQALTSGG